jgi:Clp amino terminal domain, pathogenicity island component
MRRTTGKSTGSTKNSRMFQRYTNEAKLALYHGARTALHQGATVIDPTHLLLGLVTEDSRANYIFRLRELLPEETNQQSDFKKQHSANKWELVVEHTSKESSKKPAPNVITMSSAGRRILACAAQEANGLQDYWIDAEHIVLGILREGDNAASSKLRAVGLELEGARQQVTESKGNRPPRPNPVLWWPRWRPMSLPLVVVFILGITTAFILLGIGRWGIALTLVILTVGQLLKTMGPVRFRMTRWRIHS